jgi:hypothetical protein
MGLLYQIITVLRFPVFHQVCLHTFCLVGQYDITHCVRVASVCIMVGLNKELEVTCKKKHETRDPHVHYAAHRSANELISCTVVLTTNTLKQNRATKCLSV